MAKKQSTGNPNRHTGIPYSSNRNLVNPLYFNNQATVDDSEGNHYPITEYLSLDPSNNLIEVMYDNNGTPVREWIKAAPSFWNKETPSQSNQEFPGITGEEVEVIGNANKAPQLSVEGQPMLSLDRRRELQPIVDFNLATEGMNFAQKRAYLDNLKYQQMRQARGLDAPYMGGQLPSMQQLNEAYHSGELTPAQRYHRDLQKSPAKDIDKVMLGTLGIGVAPFVAMEALPALGTLATGTSDAIMSTGAGQAIGKGIATYAPAVLTAMGAPMAYNAITSPEGIQKTNRMWQIFTQNPDWYNFVNYAKSGLGDAMDISMAAPLIKPLSVNPNKWSTFINKAREKVADGMKSASTYLQNNYPALFDPYTSWDATLGYHGDNLLSRITGTVGRRYGYTPKAEIPEFHRRLSINKPEDFRLTEDGKFIMSSGREGQGHDGIVNFATSEPARGHSRHKTLSGIDDFIVAPQALRGISFESIQPSDTFFQMPSNNSIFSVDPKYVTLVSGNPETLSYARGLGMRTLSSPKLRQLESTKMSKEEIIDSRREGIGRFLLNVVNERGNAGPIGKEIQRLTSMRGAPTIQDYAFFENATGLNSGVIPKTPFNEENAKSILGRWGRVRQAPVFNHVIYDPATNIEALYREAKTGEGTWEAYNEALNRLPSARSYTGDLPTLNTAKQFAKPKIEPPKITPVYRSEGEASRTLSPTERVFKFLGKEVPNENDPWWAGPSEADIRPGQKARAAIRRKVMMQNPTAQVLREQGVDVEKLSIKDLQLLEKKREEAIKKAAGEAEVGRYAITDSNSAVNLYNSNSSDVFINRRDKEMPAGQIGRLSFQTSTPEAYIRGLEGNFVEAPGGVVINEGFDKYKVPSFIENLGRESGERGVSKDLYDAALYDMKERGSGEGIASGGELLSPEATTRVVTPENYNLSLISENGGQYQYKTAEQTPDWRVGPVWGMESPTRPIQIPVKNKEVFDINTIDNNGVMHVNMTPGSSVLQGYAIPVTVGAGVAGALYGISQQDNSNVQALGGPLFTPRNLYAGGGPKRTYKAWKDAIQQHKGINIDEDDSYDYRSYYINNTNDAWDMLNKDSKAHFIDDYKRPRHSTYSDQSIYSHPPYIQGGHWEYNKRFPNLMGQQWNYQLSPTQVDSGWDYQDTIDYAIDAENDGFYVTDSQGRYPIVAGTVEGGVLPNVDVGPTYYPKKQYAEGGSLNTPKPWDELSIKEKAEMIEVAVSHGLTSLADIKAKYNELMVDGNLYARGGRAGRRGGSANRGYNAAVQRAMNYFMGKGLTQYQAAGLVGNLMRESSLQIGAVNPKSGAYGIAQWLGNRKKNLFALYGNAPTLDQQLDYVWHELNTTHRNGLRHLKNSKDAAEAARNIFGYYEFSAGPEGALAAMNKTGQNGTTSLNRGIQFASNIMGIPYTPYEEPKLEQAPDQQIDLSNVPFEPWNPYEGLPLQSGISEEEKARLAAQEAYYEKMQAAMERQQIEADRKNRLNFLGSLINYASNVGQGGSSTEGIGEMALNPFTTFLT